RQVLLRGHRVEHPPQAVQREQRAQHLHDPQRHPGQVARRLLRLVLGEQRLLVDGGCLVAVGACRHQFSSTSRTTVTPSVTSGGSGTGGCPGTWSVRSPSAVAAIASSPKTGWSRGGATPRLRSPSGAGRTGPGAAQYSSRRAARWAARPATHNG